LTGSTENFSDKVAAEKDNSNSHKYRDSQTLLNKNTYLLSVTIRSVLANRNASEQFSRGLARHGDGFEQAGNDAGNLNIVELGFGAQDQPMCQQWYGNGFNVIGGHEIPAC